MRDSFTFAILGAGGRGHVFSEWLAQHPQAGSVVAVADPDVERRGSIARQHNIPESMQFESWRDLLDRPQLADVAINTLMDPCTRPPP